MAQKQAKLPYLSSPDAVSGPEAGMARALSGTPVALLLLNTPHSKSDFYATLTKKCGRNGKNPRGKAFLQLLSTKSHFAMTVGV